MDVLEAIRTTRSMRRLDPARDVSDEDLVTIVDAATRAPTGGNSQPVRWLVVRDPELKRRVGEVYRSQARTRLVAYEQDAKTDPEVARMLRSARHLAEHMGEAPALLIPCARAERGRAASSVFPAVQNLMLAARALGLGTTLTTIHLGDEGTVREILSIPEDVQTFAIIPVGYPLGRWGEARRRPVSEVTYWDGWRQTRPPGSSAMGLSAG
ncbi:MAG TPA: nitroreductase family protein [Candidatus Dormibacteraeota bacterium]|nr:nitroreductase family protein [Candidatus Dormibacteraeota bacterium]